MDGRRLVVVMAGGALGATLRWGIAEAFDGGLSSTGFAWATFVANLVGTALLAVVLARPGPALLRAALATGFCGGLTTMSTFAVELAERLRQDEFGAALTYGAASLLAGLAVFIAARRLALPRDKAEETPA